MPLMNLEAEYEALCQAQSDITDALPVLRLYASKVKHVTEFGIRTAVSTTALLAAQPDTLISYDIGLNIPRLEHLHSLRGRTNFIYHQGDTRVINIEATDLLFIDTLHTYGQLQTELSRHAGKVIQYLIFHDTAGFRFRDEIETATEKKGLWPAIEEMMARERCWEIVFELQSGFGLTVLKRKMQHL
jgi:hypothetical protein